MNIAKDVIKHFANEERIDILCCTECGLKDFLTKPFGELISKFDTGNSGMRGTPDKYKINGNEIKWSLLNKTLTSKIVQKKKYQ